MNIYLLRHGETAWNREGRMQGRRDIPMNEAGIAHVRQTAARLRELEPPVQTILSSPLIRARKTAEIAAEAIGYPKEEIVICSDLMERSFGEAEGSTPQERREKYPDGIYPGMESADALCRRAAGVLERCVGTYSGRTVLIVSHGMMIKALMAAASGQDFDGGSLPITGPASLSLMEYENGRFRLQIDNARDQWFH